MHTYLTQTEYPGDLCGLGDNDPNAIDMSNFRFYSNGIILSNPLRQDVRDAINAVINKAMKAMPWTGGQLQGEAALIMNANRIPLVDPNSSVPNTDTKQQQWAQFVSAFNEATAPAFSDEQTATAEQARELAANTAFWDTVYRINLAVATVGLSELAPEVKAAWQNLQAKIKEWNDTKNLANGIANHKDCPADKAAKLQAKVAEMDSSITGKIVSLTAKIPGLQPALQEQGLGVLAIFSALGSVSAVISLAAIAAIAAMIVYAIKMIVDLIHSMGLDTLAKTVSDSMASVTKFLGPAVGIAALGLVGFLLYRKFKKKAATT